LGAVEAVRPLYDAADLYLSTSSYEGFGLAVAQAMARGLAVVACPGGAVEELVDARHTGLVVPPDAADLARAVLELASDPAGRARLGEEGRARAETLRAEKMAEEYERLYQSLASGKR
jgi:glycosyltransferase involved in cell wall biosynthesis